MFKGGRPCDSVWHQFTSVTVAEKEYAKCKMCDNQQLAKAYRLKLHYVKCSAAHQLPEVTHTHERPITMKRDRSPLPPPVKHQALCMPIISEDHVEDQQQL